MHYVKGGSHKDWKTNVRVCGENEHKLWLLRLQKAQYCLLAHSNQTELLVAHWDFFQSSRLPLHHWQQVWKQLPRTISWSQIFFGANYICLGWSFYSKHHHFYVHDILKSLREANRAEERTEQCQCDEITLTVWVSSAKYVSTSLRVLSNSLVCFCHQAR